VVKPPPILCDGITLLPTNDTKPIYGNASAALVSAGATTRFTSGNCHTLRNTDGVVAQYAADFVDGLPYGGTQASITIKAKYAGDGTYDADLRWKVTNGSSGAATATAVLTQAGAHAVVTSDEATLTYDCDPGAALDLQPGQVGAWG
jgi:hypothetical protein